MKSIYSDDLKLDDFKNCLSSDFEWYYTCVVIFQKHYSAKQEFSVAYSLLYSLKERNQFKVSSSSMKEEIDHRLVILKLLQNQKILKSKILEVNDFTVTLNVAGHEKDFLIDLGAELSSTSKLGVSKESVGVSSFTGTKYLFSPEILTVGEDDEILFFTNATHNILGQNFVKKYSKIIFQADPKKTYVTRFFQDGSSIFFFGAVNYDDSKFDRLRFCIDTGSSDTVIMPKAYRKLRDKIIHLELLTHSLNELGGKGNLLGKILPKVDLIIGNSKKTMQNVVAIAKSNASLTCDVVLGRDYLSHKLVAIDFSNMEIYFRSDSL